MLMRSRRCLCVLESESLILGLKSLDIRKAHERPEA